MRGKLPAGLAVLMIAFLLQFSLAFAGLRIDLSYAALIAFAFVFGFWELILLVLAAVLVVNWQPAASPELLVFALYPCAIYFLRNILHWQVWLEDLLATLFGFAILYFAISRAAFAGEAFLADVIVSMVFSALVVLPLHRWGKA